MSEPGRKAEVAALKEALQEKTIMVDRILGLMLSDFTYMLLSPVSLVHIKRNMHAQPSVRKMSLLHPSPGNRFKSDHKLSWEQPGLCYAISAVQ